jgi:[ribosomal protein S18]-alanine N-acetyltransferase
VTGEVAGEVTREGFRVRRGGPRDLAGVMALERWTPEAPHWSEEQYREIVEAGEGAVRRCLFIAEEAGGFVGFAVGKVIGGEEKGAGELESVAVRAEARRRGVGKALCEAVARWSEEQGARVLELEVRARSAGAVALYEGMGFVEVGRRRGYYSQPADDALLMQMDLAGWK